MARVFVDPADAVLSSRRRWDRFFFSVLFVILAGLLFFIGKHAVIAVIAVRDSGGPLVSVPFILKTFFTSFFEGFGDLSGKYLLMVTLMLLVNVVCVVANKVFRLFEKQAIYWLIFAVSVAISFNLPLDRLYQDYTRTGKTLLFCFCLFMVIVAPSIVGRFLTTTPCGQHGSLKGPVHPDFWLLAGAAHSRMKWAGYGFALRQDSNVVG